LPTSLAAFEESEALLEGRREPLCSAAPKLLQQDAAILIAHGGDKPAVRRGVVVKVVQLLSGLRIDKSKL
jgi:hypothetical protein